MKDVETELLNNLLPDMHIGECRRDAAAGARGFMFQDLLAVEELIEEGTEYICSEYIEDVFVVTSNGIRIIQSKYTPKTDLDIKEITRELYYQYIKLRGFGYGGEIIPILKYHGDKVTVPDKETAKNYLNLPAEHQQFKGTADEVKAGVKVCIQLGNKKQREDSLFASFYEPDELKKFLSVYKMKEVEDNIGNYRKALGEKLDTFITTDCCPVDNKEDRQGLLIALATKFVQERYNDSNKQENNRELLENRKLQRKLFLLKLNQAMNSEPPFGIIISSFVDEAYCEIADEQLFPEDCIRLNALYASTIEWVKNELDSCNGVVKLLNTVSTDTNVPNENDGTQTLRKALYCCKDVIVTFFHYIWKIKLDLKQDTFKECLLPGISEYIAFSFHKQRDWSKCSIIMGYVDPAHPKAKLLNVQKRLRAFEGRPQKWYLKNPCGGIGDYSIDTARIAPKKLDVTLISPEQFAVECMDCINVDTGDWAITEDCASCIFSCKCPKKNEQ